MSALLRMNSKTNDLVEVWLPSCRTFSKLMKDKDGNPEPVWDPKGRKSVYDLDEAGRVSRVVHSDGTALRYKYDLAGALVSVDNEHAEVRFERDLCRRIVREETLTHDDAGPLAVRSTYDLAGDRQRVETSLGLDMLVRRDMMGDATGVEVARALGPDLALTPVPSRVDGPIATGPATGSGPLGVAPARARSGEVLWWAGFERDGLEVTRHLPGGITTRWQRHAVLGLPGHG